MADGWVSTSPRSRPIALSWITRRLFTCQTARVLWKGGGATPSLLRPPCSPRSPLLSPLPTPVVSQSPFVLPKPGRGKRDRRNLLALGNKPELSESKSVADGPQRLCLATTASDGKYTFFHVSAAQGGAISADSTQRWRACRMLY